MEEEFEIIGFKFKAKSLPPIMIYARKEETALEILKWWNLDAKKEDIYKKCIFYTSTYITEIEPYVLEQDELETAKKMYQKRMDYLKK